MRTVFLAIIVMLVVILTGCQESQSQLPQDWRDVFGNDNISKLNFRQTQALDRHSVMLQGLKVVDPNGEPVLKDGKPIRQRGLIERVETLERWLVKIETSNAEQHKKLGETDIRFHKRIEALESDPNAP